MTRKPYLWEKSPGVWYVRRAGRYARIRAAPGTADFDREYWEILHGQIKSKTTWAALIASYRLSTRWTNLKPRTRADYEKVFAYIEDRVGDRDATRVERRHIIAAMEANKHRVRFANYFAQVSSILFEHARDIGWMDKNPARGVKGLAMPEANKQPHLPWPEWAVARWRAEARPLHRLIFEVGIGSVQRPADWTRFRWGDYDGDVLRMQQGKTNKALVIPCTEHLRRALDGQTKKGLTIIGNEKGQPLTYDALAQRMLKERKRLETTAYDLHALRYTGVQELAMAGCTDDEIASYSGHTSKAMIAKYAGAARQRMRAIQARTKRQNRTGTERETDTRVIRLAKGVDDD